MGKIEKKIDEQNGNIRKEIEYVKGNKKNILDLKSLVTEMNDSLE